MLSSGYAQEQRHTYFDIAKTQIKESYVVKSPTSSVLHGNYESFYENGNKKSQGQFTENISSGIWTYYYSNDNVKMRGEVKNGSSAGYWEYFYESGKPSMAGNIQDGKRNGPWSLYFVNGMKKSEGDFQLGEKTGVWKYYHESGIVKAHEINHADSSFYAEFYANGNVKMEGRNVNELREGKWTFYYEDGTKEAFGFYRRNKKFGPWSYFNEFGRLSAQGSYINEQTDGIWTYFHENGNVSSQGKFYKDERDGEWKLFYEDGAIKGDGYFELGSGQYQEYYQNGQPKLKGQIVNGMNQGKWQYFYENGKLEGECIFKNGDGDYVGYFSKGPVNMKGKIKDDKKIGIWTLYEIDGEIAGYYRPFYEDGAETFWLAEQSVEQKALVQQRKLKSGSYQFKSRRLPYFDSKVNEYQAFIVNYNPIAPVAGLLPIGFEHYIEERLGHELLYHFMRDPFLQNHQNLKIATQYSRGHSIALVQKFYHREQKYGLPYFGHEARYTNRNYYANDLIDSVRSTTNGTIEQKFEYSVFIGSRYMKNSKEGGFTLDFRVGAGAGYRQTDFYLPTSDLLMNTFDSINDNKFSYAIRFSLNFGYAFNLTGR